MTTQPIIFDTFEEAAELINVCGKCNHPRIFLVGQRFVDDNWQYELVRCPKYSNCNEHYHCNCPPPTLTSHFDHNDVKSAVSS